MNKTTINHIKKKFRVLISGYGKIGKRHLESLNKIKDIQIIIDVYDIKNNFLNLKFKNKIRNNIEINFINNLPKHKKYFLVILAMNSNERFKFIKIFLAYNSCLYMLSEKIVFSSHADFSKLGKILDYSKNNFIVNCNKRVTGIYKRINSMSQNSKIKNIEVIGTDWGLACNTIHYIDLFCWLHKSNSIKIKKNCLKKKIFESKRKGYVEFYGSLEFSIQDSTLKVKCEKGEEKKLNLKIELDDYIILLDEIKEVVTFKNKKNESYRSSKFFNNKVSNTTKDILEELISIGHVNLANFNDTRVHHHLLLKELSLFYNKYNKSEQKKMMIT